MIKLLASSLFVVELVASGVEDGTRTNHGHPGKKVFGNDRPARCKTGSGRRVQMATAVGLSFGSEGYASVVTRCTGFTCRCTRTCRVVVIYV